MIDFIRGQVQRVAESHVVVDVGGIGIRVEATPATVAELAGDEVKQVPTSLVIRDDSWTIYGFADTDERDVFDLVQTVSGVGPRTAQALVATLTPDGLRRAINQQDIAAVMKVPGIGRKGAQRIILELTDRLGTPTTPTEPSGHGPVARDSEWRTAVVTGLASLGWSSREAESAASAVEALVPDATDADGRVDVATLLREAPRELKRS